MGVYSLSNFIRIRLVDMIKDNKYSHLKDIDIVIDKVEILKESMELNISMESSRILEAFEVTDIKEFFQENFINFNINLEVKVKNDEIKEIDIEKYFERLNLILQERVASSKSWIKDSKWEKKEDIVIFHLPNMIAYFSLTRNGILDELRDQVKRDLNKNLEIVQVENESIDESFLEEKYLEERIISKEILLNSPKETNGSSKKNSKKYSFGKLIKDTPININEINLQTGTAVIKGSVFDIDSRKIRGNKTLATFHVSDGTDSITVKVFLGEDQSGEFLENLDNDSYILAEGDITFDNYSKCIVMMLRSLTKIEKEEREDKSVEKRVELHLHTQMSSMDGISTIQKLATRAKKWGHEAIAITDHGVVQGFPEGMDIGRKLGIKIIYGLEGYMINDKKDIVINYDRDKEYNSFVVFDLETTGLSAINDMITEIGAVKIVDGVVVDTFSELINPERPIPPKITEITGITDEMVKDKPTINMIISSFKEFIGDSVLVAHNASFDLGFIREKMRINNIKINNPVLDTLELSRAVFPDLKSHRLNIIAKHLDISLINHHRAVDDATATAEIFLKILYLLNEKGVYNFNQINSLNHNKNNIKDEVFHVTILAKNQIGLKNLYRLVSESHLKYFHRRPRLPKSFIEENREGLLIGGACEGGELYKAIIKNRSYNEIQEIVKFYDYLEIQPTGNNMHLVREGIVKDVSQLQGINKKIYDLAKKHNKLVVATGDVHFLDPEDEVYRRIIMSGQGFSDADSQPPLYFMTTDEMLKEFSYLGEDIAREVVIENTNIVNNMVEDILPIPDGTYPPIIEGAEEELKNITYAKAHEIYGEDLPDIVKKRLDRELTSIIKNGYAVMYIIAQKLVWKSLEDGYLVGSRGSVGSSFAATMAGITEVNPLSPHYVCPECKYSEFFDDGSIASGSDLPNKNCPKCDTMLNKDGQDIPFEVFLGFEGDKEPDIDLNFAGEYQSTAHKYTEELFGEGYVFRAGTIGTIADKTAYGFVKKYCDEREININPAEINRLVQGCTGIKRTSGQHPGGVMIVPKYKDVLDFTPIQYPADDKTSGVITTHFDYNAISGRILKLDILGHDVPTIIRMLEDITGVDPTAIPLDEPSTMELFTSTKPLGVTKEDISCPVGTLGIPEFGTKFVRQMLVDTKPTTFSELVRISGLSHGTDVWLNNAQDLVRKNIAPLSKVISTREDIMLYLINAGLDKMKSFKIMENVRRGKGLSPQDEADMRSLSLPDWYIDSCNKIKYMFPKAHAAAYVMMSFRIAYFKVHYPLAFYATYFTTKAADFDGQLILSGREAVKNKIDELESLGNDASTKEKNQLTVLEVANEMYARGFAFEKVDLYKSHSDRFVIGEKGIIPPLKGLIGVGENAARKIVEERNITHFISIEDLVKRAKVTRPVIEALVNHGCLEDLPENNQMSLFSV